MAELSDLLGLLGFLGSHDDPKYLQFAQTLADHNQEPKKIDDTNQGTVDT